MLLRAALVDAKFDDSSDKLLRYQNIRGNYRFPQFVYFIGGRQPGGIIDLQRFTARCDDLENNRGRGGNQLEIVFTLQALLHDLHVQHAEKPAAKPESQGRRGLRLEVQCRIIESQLLQGFAKRLVIFRTDRKQAGKDPRLYLLEAGQRRLARPASCRQSVANRGAVNVLYARDDITDFAGPECLAIEHFRREHPDPVGRVRGAGGHHGNLGALRQAAVHDPHQRDDADVIVEPGIDNQCLQGLFRFALRRRYSCDDLVQKFGHAGTRLGTDPQRVLSINADDVLDFCYNLVRVGGRQIDLVENRQDLEALIDRRNAIRDALGLDALRRVDHQQRALARRQRARHLVGKIDVARRVDKIQLIFFSIFGRKRQ